MSRISLGGNNSPRPSGLVLLALATVLAVMLQPTHGYASWLKCYVELDEEEVVMHHSIVSAEQAREKVFIEVQAYRRESDGGARDGASLWTSEDYLLHPRTSDGTLDVTTLKVRLKVPPTMAHEDVQFVVEAKGEGVKFIDLGVMCDGSRAFSRRHDEHVILQINSTGGSGGSKDDVELVAGWASGHEAVKLTPMLTLRRNEAAICDSDTSCEQEL